MKIQMTTNSCRTPPRAFTSMALIFVFTCFVVDIWKSRCRISELTITSQCIDYVVSKSYKSIQHFVCGMQKNGHHAYRSRWRKSDTPPDTGFRSTWRESRSLLGRRGAKRKHSTKSRELWGIDSLLKVIFCSRAQKLGIENVVEYLPTWYIHRPRLEEIHDHVLGATSVCLSFFIFYMQILNTIESTTTRYKQLLAKKWITHTRPVLSGRFVNVGVPHTHTHIQIDIRISINEQ